MRRTPGPLERVVVVGGGFGGLYAAHHLARQPVEVTLIDRHNFHLFQPPVYRLGRVATFLERVEDEVEAVLERGGEVVADLGDVPADELGEVRELLGEIGDLPLPRELVEVSDLLLRDRRGLRGALNVREPFEETP